MSVKIKHKISLNAGLDGFCIIGNIQKVHAKNLGYFNVGGWKGEGGLRHTHQAKPSLSQLFKKNR